MTREKFEDIKYAYSDFLIIDADVQRAFDFVRDCMEAECDYLKENEPQATKTIQELEVTIYRLFDLGSDIDNDEFFK